MEKMTAEETAALEAMQADAPGEMQEAPEVAAPVTLAEPEQKPEPAKAEPTAEAPDADKPPPGYVPQGALHQERERRKATEQQFQALQAKLAEIEARLNPPKPEPEIVVPDPVLQPEAFKQFQIDQIKQRAAESRKNNARRKRQRRNRP
ncbi:MAG: hypothetical protein HC889_12635 [Synechococcaceae cyanobacterium SM1_2_3]|nr:hypothetical protein [Synechococcaceae cyanobacterium SM1_2_3]